MGGYTDGEYNGGMAESSADYGGGITYEENQQYKVQGFLGLSPKWTVICQIERSFGVKFSSKDLVCVRIQRFAKVDGL